MFIHCFYKHIMPIKCITDELISIRKEFGHCMKPSNIIKEYFIKFDNNYAV